MILFTFPVALPTIALDAAHSGILVPESRSERELQRRIAALDDLDDRLAKLMRNANDAEQIAIRAIECVQYEDRPEEFYAMVVIPDVFSKIDDIVVSRQLEWGTASERQIDLLSRSRPQLSQLSGIDVVWRSSRIRITTNDTSDTEGVSSVAINTVNSSSEDVELWRGAALLGNVLQASPPVLRLSDQGPSLVFSEAGMNRAEGAGCVVWLNCSLPEEDMSGLGVAVLIELLQESTVVARGSMYSQLGSLPRTIYVALEAVEGAIINVDAPSQLRIRHDQCLARYIYPPTDAIVSVQQQFQLTD